MGWRSILPFFLFLTVSPFIDEAHRAVSTTACQYLKAMALVRILFCAINKAPYHAVQ
jgi:hypothetical protein